MRRRDEEEKGTIKKQAERSMGFFDCRRMTDDKRRRAQVESQLPCALFPVVVVVILSASQAPIRGQMALSNPGHMSQPHYDVRRERQTRLSETGRKQKNCICNPFVDRSGGSWRATRERNVYRLGRQYK